MARGRSFALVRTTTLPSACPTGWSGATDHDHSGLLVAPASNFPRCPTSHSFVPGVSLIRWVMKARRDSHSSALVGHAG